MYEPYQQHLSILHDTNKYRRLPLTRQDNQKSYVDFSTNDYLKLGHNSEITDASIAAVQYYGTGATGSRLLSGNYELLETFESRIAQDKNTDSALIFNTGFQANLSVLSAILDAKVLGNKPVVFFDKLNHASLYQAIFLTRPELVRYNHNNMDHLESLLKKYQQDKRPKFIVTETVFGMDGDILPLAEIVHLARKHKAFLYLDEAHATGIFGDSGYGLSTSADLTDVPAIIMGTFSKALAGSGGYIACGQVLKEYLINKASGFIYSTAPSPMVIGAAAKAWEIVGTLHQARSQLLSLSAILRNKLLHAGFDIGNSTTHIVPVIFKKEELALKVKEKLYENDIIVSCIRPPTVPPHSSRIRIALNTGHQEPDIEKLVTLLGKP